MNRFFKNVAWLQGANLISLLAAFLITFGYFLQDDVLGKKYLAFYLGLFVVFETYRLLLSWEPGDIMIKAIASNKGDREACNQLAHQGFCFAMGFASLCALSIYLSAPYVVDFFFSNWLTEAGHPSNARELLIIAIKSSAFIPTFHSLFSWAIALLQAKEHMKASTPLMILMNLSRPLGALAGLLYAKHQLGIGQQDAIEYFPHMINGIVVFFAISLLPMLFIVKIYYYGLLTSLMRKPWVLPTAENSRAMFQLSGSKKIVELYSRFPMWLALFCLSPLHFLLMTICLKIFEYSKQPFGPVSKSLLPQLALLASKKRYKHINSMVRRVNVWGLLSGLLLGAVTAVACLYILFPHLIKLAPEHIRIIQDNVLPLLATYLFMGFSITNGVIFIVFDMTHQFLKLSLIQIPLCGLAAFYLIDRYEFLGVCLYMLFNTAFINLVTSYFAHRKLKNLLVESNN